ncbi:hypothetical protein Goklo_000310 [Gossypium klotzschianum]|uniref:Uncharacterized protein n=1 Tax=Gossypium klotzschianum TaxID=34286 RepID=A0A7J8VX54_9ROSI|nr:hypothetical protein [Gossypium klotzschianum]
MCSSTLHWQTLCHHHLQHAKLRPLPTRGLMGRKHPKLTCSKQSFKG